MQPGLGFSPGNVVFHRQKKMDQIRGHPFGKHGFKPVASATTGRLKFGAFGAFRRGCGISKISQFDQSLENGARPRVHFQTAFDQVGNCAVIPFLRILQLVDPLDMDLDQAVGRLCFA